MGRGAPMRTRLFRTALLAAGLTLPGCGGGDDGGPGLGESLPAPGP